ncbi:hypothetical protein HBB16_09515 [Pseudonocardia sp. MCCB 268]|nr:hypothetical protein [Pseudonocardia cytotoxica]
MSSTSPPALGGLALPPAAIRLVGGGLGVDAGRWRWMWRRTRRRLPGLRPGAGALDPLVRLRQGQMLVNAR